MHLTEKLDEWAKAKPKRSVILTFEAGTWYARAQDGEQIARANSSRLAWACNDVVHLMQATEKR